VSLPHGFPFELVDRVDGPTARVRISAGAWWGRDGEPMLLGLLVEAGAQAAALLLGGGRGPEPGATIHLAAIENATCERLPAAGESLELRARATARYGPTSRIEVELTRDGARIGGATLLVSESGS